MNIFCLLILDRAFRFRAASVWLVVMTCENARLVGYGRETAHSPSMSGGRWKEGPAAGRPPQRTRRPPSPRRTGNQPRRRNRCRTSSGLRRRSEHVEPPAANSLASAMTSRAAARRRTASRAFLSGTVTTSGIFPPRPKSSFPIAPKAVWRAPDDVDIRQDGLGPGAVVALQHRSWPCMTQQAGLAAGIRLLSDSTLINHVTRRRMHRSVRLAP